MCDESGDHGCSATLNEALPLGIVPPHGVHESNSPMIGADGAIVSLRLCEVGQGEAEREMSYRSCKSTQRSKTGKGREECAQPPNLVRQMRTFNCRLPVCSPAAGAYERMTKGCPGAAVPKFRTPPRVNTAETFRCSLSFSRNSIHSL